MSFEAAWKLVVACAEASEFRYEHFRREIADTLGWRVRQLDRAISLIRKERTPAARDVEERQMSVAEAAIRLARRTARSC
jgi:hypothetical protein